MSYGRPRFDLAYATFDGVSAFTRPAYSAADAEWTEPSSVEARVAAASPLGAIQIVAKQDVSAIVSAASMLGAAAVLGEQYPFAYVSVASPLGAALVLVTHDFSGAVGLTTIYYTMDLVTPGGNVRVPISSWQATLQTVNQCYASCVVPGAQDWIEPLTEATEFIITRQATVDGVVLAYEMARAPLSTLQLDQGPTNQTASLSGYYDAYEEDADPPSGLDRTLSDIRSISTYTSGVRVRCAVDWFLRPAQRAHYNSTSLVVSYINFYGQMNTQTPDEYMDVGERI